LPDAASPRNANLYTYTNNNPNDYTDPNGLEPLKTDFFEGDLGLRPQSAVNHVAIEANATNVEIAFQKASFPESNMEVQLLHAEAGVGTGSIGAELALVTVYGNFGGPATGEVPGTGGGVTGRKMEVGILTRGGIGGVGFVETYTTPAGLTYEAPHPNGTSGSGFGSYVGGMLLINDVISKDRAAAAHDAHEIDMANAGLRECAEMENSCNGGQVDTRQTQSDENGNIVTPGIGNYRDVSPSSGFGELVPDSSGSGGWFDDQKHW
ncbi:hypothetical protein, partial [Streptomyces sp. NPDC088748]|uniref:hypothetical protein n=1 Tax=Streptomyces sp. NPDC088748 TaxID=3365887 RepID=UPI0037F22819